MARGVLTDDHQECWESLCMQSSILRMHMHLHGFVDSLLQSSSKQCCSTVVQVIVISFTLIISLMLGTFAFVLKVGAVRFNEWCSSNIQQPVVVQLFDDYQYISRWEHSSQPCMQAYATLEHWLLHLAQVSCNRGFTGQDWIMTSDLFSDAQCWNFMRLHSIVWSSCIIQLHTTFPQSSCNNLALP